MPCPSDSQHLDKTDQLKHAHFLETNKECRGEHGREQDHLDFLCADERGSAVAKEAISGGVQFINWSESLDPRRSSFKLGTATLCRSKRDGKGGECLSAGNLGRKGDVIVVLRKRGPQEDIVKIVGRIKDIDSNVGKQNGK